MQTKQDRVKIMMHIENELDKLFALLQENDYEDPEVSDQDLNMSQSEKDDYETVHCEFSELINQVSKYHFHLQHEIDDSESKE